jgi:hypothetical protein
MPFGWQATRLQPSLVTPPSTLVIVASHPVGHRHVVAVTAAVLVITRVCAVLYSFVATAAYAVIFPDGHFEQRNEALFQLGSLIALPLHADVQSSAFFSRLRQKLW